MKMKKNYTEMIRYAERSIYIVTDKNSFEKIKECRDLRVFYKFNFYKQCKKNIYT